jgi:prophage regulatory protein
MLMYELIRGKKVEAINGFARSTRDERIIKGLHPKPVEVPGFRYKPFIKKEIEIVNAAIIAGYTEEEIRELIKKLEAGRKKGATDYIRAAAVAE